MEVNSGKSPRVAEGFAGLLHRLVRLKPKLVFPDESVAAMRKQLRSLRKSSSANPEDRMFLFRILFILKSRSDSPTMGELSAELGIPLSTTTRMADALVRARFAARCPDEKDRRVVRLCITERGRQFIEAGMNFVKQKIGQVLKHFTAEEQAQLLRLMSKLVDSLQAEQSQPSPGGRDDL